MPKYLDIDWINIGLGTKSDRKLAKELQISQSTVEKHRRGLGIPAFRESQHINWDNENIGLGKKPDGELARELGVHREVVTGARERRGIPICKANRGKVRWDIIALGSRPDKDIAQELGVSFTVVNNKRNELGIANYNPPPKQVDWDTVPLGAKPDPALARELGVSRKRVEMARKRLGISAFVGLTLLQEDVPCRSIYEAMYDAYLHWKNISHKHEVKIPGLPYITDIKLEGHYVEIVGMIANKRYANKHAQKRRDLEKHNIPVVWLYPHDVEQLFADCPIPLKFRPLRHCTNCGKEQKRIIKGLCMSCYMQAWHKQDIHEATCASCGKMFSYHDNDSPKYCSRKCYWESLELDWPSWEWIDEQLQHISIRQLAMQLGVKYTALYMRIRRRNKRQV